MSSNTINYTDYVFHIQFLDQELVTVHSCKDIFVNMLGLKILPTPVHFSLPDLSTSLVSTKMSNKVSFLTQLHASYYHNYKYQAISMSFMNKQVSFFRVLSKK